MIYAVYDFDTALWNLLGDYDTEFDVLEYFAILVEAPCYRSHFVGLFVIGSFDRDRGSFDQLPCRRIMVHRGDAENKGGELSGGTPPEVVCGEACGAADHRPWYKKLSSAVTGFFCQ